MTMLQIEALAKQYSAFRLGPLTLEVGGEVLGVLGPSGSGKTTLLSLIAGTTTPTEGRVRLDGVDLATRSLETRGTARVFQESALFPHLTGRENVAYAATAPSRVDELAARLEIEDVLDQPARTLSGGEGRRVEVARALAAEPDVLLLDEPTAGLDTPVRRRLREHLRILLTTLDIPVFYVTHNQKEVATVADRVLVLHDGTAAQVGTPADVTRRPATPFVARFSGNPNVIPARMENTAGGTAVVWSDGRIPMPTAGDSAPQDVWMCIRPEDIELRDEGGKTATIEGAIQDRRFDGHAHELTVRLGSQSPPLSVHVLPPTYRTRHLDRRERVFLFLPPDAIHVIPRSV